MLQPIRNRGAPRGSPALNGFLLLLMSVLSRRILSLTQAKRAFLPLTASLGPVARHSMLAIFLSLLIAFSLSPQVLADDGEINNLPPIPLPEKKHPNLDSALA